MMPSTASSKTVKRMPLAALMAEFDAAKHPLCGKLVRGRSTGWNDAL
jgi:hypothetical protein